MRIFFICFFIASIVSCKKKTEIDVVTQIKETLSANSAKEWRLSKLYVNGAPQTLIAGQLIYKKTYMMNVTRLDADGYSGTFTIENPLLLKYQRTMG